MTTVVRAWDAFMQAIIEAGDMHARGDDPLVVYELLRRARELLEIIEAELAEQLIEIPGAAGAVLSQLRGRLRSLERVVGAPSLH